MDRKTIFPERNLKLDMAERIHRLQFKKRKRKAIFFIVELFI